MPRYVDADVLKETIENAEYFDISQIDESPTADVRENVHGIWIVDEDGNIECSVCGHHGVGDLYCEHCGALMEANGGKIH